MHARSATVLLALAACAPDPYSWDDVVPAREIPGDSSKAVREGLELLAAEGASVRWAREHPGRVAHTAWHRTGPCDVTIHLGAFSSDLLLSISIWHELVHCVQPHGGDAFARELPAIRQGVQVMRSQLLEESDIEHRVSWELSYYGFSADALGAAMEEHPDS